MGRQHVGHDEIAAFAQDKVNLPKDKADEYRAQARRLRERLEGYLAEHPDFTLKKMMLSGSLAKGTALRSLNDIDVACYISGADAPERHRGAARLSGRAPAQGLPELQPRSGPAADLLRHGLVPGHGPRRRCGADPLRRRPAVVRQSRQPGRRLISEDQHPAPSGVRAPSASARRRSTSLRWFGWPSSGRAHEAGARRFPLQVLHDRDDPGATLRSTGWISPTIPRPCSTSSPMSRGAICVSASCSPTTTAVGGRHASPSRCRSSIR